MSIVYTSTIRLRYEIRNAYMNQRLLSSYELGDLLLPNRVVLAPLTRARSGKDRIPNPLMSEYYWQRRSAGLLISEATSISPEGNGWNESPGIYSEAMVEGWKSVVQRVHQGGGRIFLQLWHTGRASHSSYHGGKPPVAPSALKMNQEYVHTPKGKEPPDTPRALDSAEVYRVVEDYRQAALRASAAGFDGVEIHGANGYLIDQFLQSRTNHRQDEWGGNIENRYNFLGEVTRAVCSVFPSQRVGVRISPNGNFNDMGSKDFREQFLYVAKKLDSFGLAYLHVVDGLGFGFHELGDPMTLAEFRRVYGGTLMGNCGYTQETAEAAIESGAADLIAFGRPYISNPDLVERFQSGTALNPEADVAMWYSPIGEKGYTDYPILS